MNKNGEPSLVDKTKTALDKVRTTVKQTWDNAKTQISETESQIKEGLANRIENIKNGIRRTYAQGKQEVKDTLESLTQPLKAWAMASLVIATVLFFWYFLIAIFVGNSQELYGYGILAWTVLVPITSFILVLLNYDIGKPHVRLYSLVYKSYQAINAGLVFVTLIFCFLFLIKGIESQSGQFAQIRATPGLTYAGSTNTTDWKLGTDASVIAMNNNLYWRWWTTFVLEWIMMLVLLMQGICILVIGLKSEPYNIAVARFDKMTKDEEILLKNAEIESDVPPILTTGSPWLSHVQAHVTNIDAVVGSNSVFEKEIERLTGTEKHTKGLRGKESSSKKKKHDH